MKRFFLIIATVLALLLSGCQSDHGTDHSAYRDDMAKAQEQGGITLLVALGIAVGIVFISVIFYQLTNWNRRLKVTKNKPWQQG